MLEYIPTREDRLAFPLWVEQQGGAWDRTAKSHRGKLLSVTVLAAFFLAFFLLPYDIVSERVARLLACLAVTLLAGLLAWAVDRRWSLKWIVAARRRWWATHAYQEADGPRRVWLDPSGLNASAPGTHAHWNWTGLSGVQQTPDYYFILTRTTEHLPVRTAVMIPRRLGHAAQLLAEGIRAQLAAHAVQAPTVEVETTAGDGAPLGLGVTTAHDWGGEAPGEVRFVLTAAEQIERLAWDRDRGGFVSLERDERRKLAPALVMVPVLALMWSPIFLGYPWSTAVPALVVTVGTVVSLAWAWHTAAERRFRSVASGMDQLCQLDSTADRGPTRVWLDGGGVNVAYPGVHQHHSWDVVTDIDETGAMLFFAVSGSPRVVPRRAEPQHVSWLAAGLRAGTARASAPSHGDLSGSTGLLSWGVQG